MAHDHDQRHESHAAHDHAHMDFAKMLPYLEQEAELSSPLYASVADWLREWQPEPEMIVDAGSGPGVVSCLLAGTFPQARVVAVDAVEPLLDRARERAERLGVADRFSTLRTELDDGLDDLEYPADLLWASRSLHHVGDQRAALAGFARALAPGGAVALLEGGLPARYFPRDIGIGRPGLQSRIDAIQEAGFATMRAELPGAVAETEDWPALMNAVGLCHTATRTFLLDLPAPLTDDARTFVVSSLTHRREVLGERLDADDLATVDRLLDPEDKASVHHRPDAFLLMAHTVYVGVKPQ
ncbi:class I SAM-dependent methyltransferase [Streptomyces sp. NPDC005808]|uniref:class I SAM-dependent methyltransferase n=1 Tax=Streptomyces sp. NPDC005808 TaxID=3364734 RepID=UPI0036AFB479